MAQGLGGMLGGLFGAGGQQQLPPQAQAPGSLGGPQGNILDRLRMFQSQNPGALSALGAGLMQGNMGAGFAAAGDQMADHRKVAAEQQKAAQQENMTKRWLMANKGMDEQQAEMAMSNPAILSQVLKGDERESLMNAGDGQIYDPNSGQWISSPGGGKPPQVVELFDEATGQPYKATWNQETQKYDRVGGVKARTGMTLRTNSDGSVELTQGDIAGSLPKLTEAEGRNSGFYGRGVKSHQVLTQLESQGTSLWNKAMQGVPGGLGNFGLGPEAQKFDQAQRDFVNAVLRRESGAVISEEEFANAKVQYLPQPGDSPEVITQKRANRETTIRGLEISSGQGSTFATQPPTEGTTDGWQDRGNGVRIRRIN